MAHDNQAETAICGWVDHEFDPNLIYALDKLAEEFGPMGVALAAATRTEPETLSMQLAAAFDHQRSLWSWLVSERYHVSAVEKNLIGVVWQVVDNESVPDLVAEIFPGPVNADPEDTARALASHLNRKITLALVQQAVADNSGPRDIKSAQ